MIIITPKSLRAFLAHPHTQSLLANANEPDSNGWVNLYVPLIGDCATRLDHEQYADGVCIRFEGAQWWLAIVDGRGIEIRHQRDDSAERLKKGSEAFDKATQAFNELFERVELLHQRQLALQDRTRLVIDQTPLTAAIRTKLPKDVTLDRAVWQGWFDAVLRMQAIATRRQWNVEPLMLGPPAVDGALDALVNDYQVRWPGQLRLLVTGLAAEVRFGWRCTRDDEPKGQIQSLYSGGIRDLLWSVDHIVEYAIPNFFGWHDFFFRKPDGSLGESDERERPNPRSMWLNQFAIADLPNGDMLTIDTTHDDPTKQPVRYFSHEAEGLHGDILAPNFYAFLDVWTTLGCAGNEQSQWFALVTDKGLLKKDSKVAKAWLKWLEKDSNHRKPGEQPRPQLARTAADKALLEAAKENDLDGVKASLEQGAVVNCSPDDWQDENHTALIYAAKNNNRTMLEFLRDRGASLSTTLLPLNAVLRECSVDTALWLIENGSRLDRWVDDGQSPIMTLMQREIETDEEVEEYRTLLVALLKAGANADASWHAKFNGARATPLMNVGSWSTQQLLAHGANPHVHDQYGLTAMHYARDQEQIALLKEAGVSVDVMSTPELDRVACTPLQYWLASYDDPIEEVDAFLAEGADPLVLDGAGNDAWWSVRHWGCALRLLAHPSNHFNARALDAKQQTLLHHIAHWCGGVLVDHYTEVVTELVMAGLPINAQDRDGNTVLHILVREAAYDEHAGKSVTLLRSLGADPAIANRAGKSAKASVKAKWKRTKKAME